MGSIKYILVIVLAAVFTFSGCGPAKESTGTKALQKSETINTIDQKVDYLVAQAKAFYNSKEFNDAIAVAQHVITNLDANSQEAKKLLADSKAKLSEMIKTTADDMKKKFQGLGGQ